MSSQGKTSALVRVSQLFLACVLLVVFTRGCLFNNINAGMIGVRHSAASGVNQEDFGPGWVWDVTGVHTIHELPGHYLFLNYNEFRNNALIIRTVDNNNVTVDVTVPIRIKRGEGHMIVDEGNHLLNGPTTDGGSYKFMRLADRSVRDVLRDRLAVLQSKDWYQTDKRLAVGNGPMPEGMGKSATEALNAKLAQYHLETPGILVRAYYFRQEYEGQLATIQFNEQEKLLDRAKSAVASKQQVLDNYTNQTNAQVAAKRQDWDRRLANLDRAYQVGIIDTKGDLTPGASRAVLEAYPAEEKQSLRRTAAELLDMWTCGQIENEECNPTVSESGRVPDLDSVSDEHLLGIQPIVAETREYDKRVKAKADGVKKRLIAEGDALVAAVQGAHDARVNGLLNSAAGRAYVAYNAAENVKFSDELTFQSNGGVPVVLRLYDLAKTFMGKR